MNIITKQKAKEDNLIYYFTGKPCKYGHISERLVKGGSCRMCRKVEGEKYRNQNRDEYNRYIREKKKEYYSTEKRRSLYRENIEKEMFQSAKRRAKIKKLPFTITLEDVIIPTHCPIFGIPLDWQDRLHAPTLDRIDNSLGYVKGNVQVISAKANRLKNNGSIQDFQQIIKYMQKL